VGITREKQALGTCNRRRKPSINVWRMPGEGHSRLQYLAREVFKHWIDGQRSQGQIVELKGF
jgi:hypothetical protein